MFVRLPKLSRSHSFFLFGARGTGKSSLLQAVFDQDRVLYIDLLLPEEFATLNRNPSELSLRIDRFKSVPDGLVIIDEVQRIPKLLDLVHHHMQRDSIRFALTGSSARKLKRGAANLLAGRALMYNLFPLTHIELAQDFSLDHALNWGTLPAVCNEGDPAIKRKILQAYAHTYLKEEVQAEQLIRALDPFHLFLAVAGQMSGKLINYSAISRECGASDYSVREYFSILEDTLLGFYLPPFHESIRKRQLHAHKFFLFDPGVKRALINLLNVPVVPQSSVYGDAFEEWLTVEIFRLINYRESDFKLSYLRTKDGAEIDLIIDRPGLPRAVVEIKSSKSIGPEHVKNVSRLSRDLSNTQAYCLSLDEAPKRIDNVEVLHWRDGIRELGIW
jgi:predicted AAA+ superfamily ATPase